MATKFNTNEVRQIVPVKRGKLEDWISGGYIEPSNFQASPCGKRYLWTRDDIYKLAVFKKLINFGVQSIDAYEILQASTIDEIKMPDGIDSITKIKSGIDNKIEALFG